MMGTAFASVGSFGSIAFAAEKPVMGYMIDISRDKVPTQATLHRIVDTVSGLGYNQIQLYSEHTFAYRDHREVWAKASPVSAEEIRELDAYCRQRGVELVPNQNSFGHMERWLKHDSYSRYAEIPGGNFYFKPWKTHYDEPRALCPTDPKTLDFLGSLYDELLPNFRSRLINIGCDEVLEIESGDPRCRSHAVITNSSPVAVWLDYFKKICRLVEDRGHTVMFWDDMIVRSHPELIPQLPSTAIALDWGYEPSPWHSFEKSCAALSKAGRRFYVCPGSSCWKSITGRADVMRTNVIEAVSAGRKYGAEGYLLTDWGDGGHCQPWITALPALVFMSEMVKTGRILSDAELAERIDCVTGAKCGAALLRYQRLHLVPGIPHQYNQTEIYTMLSQGCDYKRPKDMTDECLGAVFAEWRAARATLSLENAPDWVRDGFATMDLVLGAAELRWKGEHERVAAEIPSKFRELWLRYSRPGGLEDSVRKNFSVNNLVKHK